MCCTRCVPSSPNMLLIKFKLLPKARVCGVKTFKLFVYTNRFNNLMGNYLLSDLLYFGNQKGENCIFTSYISFSYLCVSYLKPHVTCHERWTCFLSPLLQRISYVEERRAWETFLPWSFWESYRHIVTAQ